MFILPYMSIDLFFVVAPFLCRTDRELSTLAKRISAAIIVAGICFLLFPLRFAFPRPHADGWFGALFGENACGQFGSAYLKSRSSDSFTAALKDFVPPQAVTISNCAALTTNATNSVTIGSPISDSATLSGATSNAGGTIIFKAFGPNDANCSGNAAYTNTVNVNGNYNSGNFTPTEAGTYRWTTDYRGDDNNQAAS